MINTQNRISNLHRTGFTVGTVVDTNDPQQTGRLRILVPGYGDNPSMPVGDVPWAMYISPLGGSVSNIERGSDLDPGDGPVSYGFWSIPKIGAAVVVTCIDGDPMSRAWVGCLHTERLAHTLPHGRFIGDDGPLDSTEKPIQPLYDNQTGAFGKRANNYEWKTRGADYSASATASGFYLNDGISKVADTEGNGYGVSQIEPDVKSEATGKNYDSQVYSWTTPGFHSISMDDRVENCRVRIRTTSGHQILMDDTNERIYINTCDGLNWIELDQDGNIDVYSTTKISIHSEGDINFSSNKSIRLTADDAIHMKTAACHIQTSSDFNVKVGGDGMITAGGTLNLKSSGQLLQQGSQIHLNGPSPKTAADALLTNRVPDHEPWARCDMKEGTHDPKYPYDSDQNGRDWKSRGAEWKR